MRDGLRIAVNSAGINGPLSPLAELPPADFDTVMRVNLYGVFHAMRCQLPAMATTGGVIVNLASIAAHAAFRGHAAYAAAKQGVLALTRTAAREYADQGIRVVSVSPGVVDTPMVTSLPPGASTVSSPPSPAAHRATGRNRRTHRVPGVRRRLVRDGQRPCGRRWLPGQVADGNTGREEHSRRGFGRRAHRLRCGCPAIRWPSMSRCST